MSVQKVCGGRIVERRKFHTCGGVDDVDGQCKTFVLRNFHDRKI